MTARGPGMIGADPRVLREMARRFDEAAGGLDGVGGAVQVWVDRSDIWAGLDNQLFRRQWESAGARSVAGAAAVLERYAAVLRANADAQDAASAADGASVAGSGLFCTEDGGGGEGPGSAADRRRVEDAENRERVSAARERTEQRLAELKRDRWWDLVALDAVERQLRDLTALEAHLRAHPEQQVLYFAVEGDQRPFFAIALGDLDTAENVALYTPGLGSGASAVGSTVGQAQAIRAAAGDGTAVILTQLYEAPAQEGLHVSGAFMDGLARAGGEGYGAFVTDLRGDLPPGTRVTAIGYSYGSHATGYGVLETEPGVIDTFISVGGTNVGDAARLQDHGVDVVAVGNRWDLADERGFVNAVDHRRYVTEHGGGGSPIPLVSDHTSYFEKGSEALEVIGTEVRGDRYRRGGDGGGGGGV